MSERGEWCGEPAQLSARLITLISQDIHSAHSQYINTLIRIISPYRENESDLVILQNHTDMKKTKTYLTRSERSIKFAFI